MLTKSKRLRTQEVEQVMKTGKSARSSHLQVKFLLSGGPPAPFRCAAVVPKSVVRKATQRNSLRRALYRALALQKTANIKGSSVVLVRAVPKDRPAAVFAEELTLLLPKLS